MKVVVNVAQVFLGKGKTASRHRRGEIVEIEGKKVPKWALSLTDAQKKEAQKAPEPEEPRTLSEMTKKESGPQKAFGQEV